MLADHDMTVTIARPHEVTRSTREGLARIRLPGVRITRPRQVRRWLTPTSQPQPDHATRDPVALRSEQCPEDDRGEDRAHDRQVKPARGSLVEAHGYRG